MKSADQLRKEQEQKQRTVKVKWWLKTPPEVHQREMVQEWLDKLPARWQAYAREKHELLARGSVVEANKWLSSLVAPLSEHLDIAETDDDIKSLADDLAFKCRCLFAEELETFSPRARHGDALHQCLELVLIHGVRIPDEFSAADKAARLSDSAWWLRNLRHSFARERERCAIDAGLVHAKAAVYCSDDTVERRGQQLRRNAELLADIEMVSRESGEVISLKSAAAAGMANQANRRNELMTRITGFEQASIKAMHVCSFVTITCPSRMHSCKKDKAGNTYKNKKYDGTTPAQAQRYLTECWARVRAQWARDKVKVYGLRIAEPHHDGTPHWHMVLFHAKGVNIKTAMIAHFCADSRDEIKHNIEPRFKVVRIDPKRGSAAGYVLKYVAKNIGGIEGGDCDELGDDSSSVDVWRRVEAWASTWRIRQFQQIGGHHVTVWRELRRIDQRELPEGGAIFHAWQAAQRHGDIKASYYEFLIAMGGLDTPPHESRVALLVDYEQKQGRYGPTTTRFHRGVRERFGDVVAFGNREHWQRV